MSNGHRAQHSHPFEDELLQTPHARPKATREVQAIYEQAPSKPRRTNFVSHSHTFTEHMPLIYSQKMNHRTVQSNILLTCDPSPYSPGNVRAVRGTHQIRREEDVRRDGKNRTGRRSADTTLRLESRPSTRLARRPSIRNLPRLTAVEIARKEDVPGNFRIATAAVHTFVP